MLSVSRNQLIQACQTTLSPDTSVETAVRIMSQSKTSYVLILEQQNIVGIFTERDVVRAIANNINLTHTTLAEVMTRNVCTIPESELQDLFTILRLMCNCKIRHLLIVNQEEKVVGIVTQTSVLQAIDSLEIDQVVESLQQLVDERTAALQEEINQHQQLAQNLAESDERKRAEQALKEREAFLRAIGDNIPNGYIYQLVRELDGSDRFYYISAGVEKTSNLKPEAILADPSLLYRKVLEEDIPYLLQKQEESIQNMSVFDVQVREYTPEGGIRWSRLCSTPRRIEDGRIIWDGIRLDITDLKQTEETLRKSKALLVEAQQVAQIGNWEFDLATQKITWTEQLFHILNRDPALGEPNYTENLDLYHPKSREKLHQAVEKSISTGEPYKLILQLKPLPDGSIRYTEGIGRAEFDAQGQVIRLYGTAQDITERVRYEKALQEKEQFLGSIYNGVEQPIFVVDVLENNEFRYVGLNPAHERFTGFHTTYLEGKTPQEILPAEIAASVQQHYQDCVEAKSAICYEEHLVLKGEDTWWITSLTPLQDEHGRIYRIVGTGINITERKRLELALQASEQRLNNILTTANASIVSFRVFANFDWEYEYQSIASETIFGYTPEEIIGDKYLWMSQVHPEDRENIIYPLFANILAERTTSVEFRFLHKDGSVRWISATYSSHRDPENDCWVVTGVGIDISDRKQAEEKLRQSETWFRTLSESAPIGIFRSDAQGKNIYTNSRFQTICGLSFTESLGDGWMQSIHPEDLEKILSRWNVLSRENQELRAEVRYIYHDSVIRFCRLIIVPIISNPPEIMGYVGTIEDITQSRAIEKMKNEFISIVSHELRTPLAAIRGSLGLIASGVLKEQPETTQQMLEIAYGDTERLVRLVNDILDLERLEANKFNFVKELHHVNDILRKSVETVAALAIENNISLEISSSSIKIFIDGDRIIQTLVNLISNSIKFSPPNSVVRLEIEELENSVLFKIKDQGRGIPQDKLESIFGRFQQVDVSDSRQKGGTGLGLAICRLIVQQHGGKIWAESVLGQGSTFYFTIPKTS
jgi:PAS domain S-box-containing protein